MPSVISGDANVSATEFGFLDGVTSGLQSQIDSKLNLAGGKILQIVRDTDTTTRTTTSSTFVDVTGLSVTITPTKSDSAIILIASVLARQTGSVQYQYLRITDSSNNAVSGAEEALVGAASAVNYNPVVLFGYATPATTSAVTYKLRFRADTNTAEIHNASMTGQLYAIEVSA